MWLIFSALEDKLPYLQVMYLDCVLLFEKSAHILITRLSQSFFSPGFIHVCESLEALYHSGQFCDFTVKVKDREFSVHKAILAARSPVFCSMFLHDMKEKITGMVDIPDCEPNIFEDFLFYLYSGKSEKISPSNVASLYDVAEKYDVQCLKKDCIRFIKANLTVDLIMDVITLAVKYTDEELLERATEFFILNAETILLTSKWQSFVIENPVPANELYIKAFRYGKN